MKENEDQHVRSLADYRKELERLGQNLQLISAKTTDNEKNIETLNKIHEHFRNSIDRDNENSNIKYTGIKERVKKLEL